ncbi:MAG: hypothetical protein A3F84_29125 [Candidatus Handelsmanbacteria bacterium RIFCSPLOWO2_12_FULL_64_10]|uniref:DUF2723 domain-containing protein n=1 Tax=Handelsmanbacteria sp. (strain RIFCSPLOWO2_12_FULL_64_10) TaxID=1817868 RepID=A0A1F6D3E7_HANXR|nr:MAG: hypothetical protein A3F84_29125 [Candidatus Handelsmanbacteria bacterium RIFCSPLOWO2_12_FULL_64_10]
MNHFDRNNRIVGGAIFLAALLIYLKTVAPTVSFWDCGEFIACAYILGVPHPPGAPLHVLVSHLLAFLPVTDEIAFRVNILSCFGSAFTVLFGYLIVVRLLRAWVDVREWSGQVSVLAGGAVGALSMGVSRAFWLNSVEAEVYSLSMMITLLAFWVALLWMDRADEPGGDRLLLLIAYLFGLGGGVHLQCWMTIPAIMLLVLFVVSRDSPSKLKVWIAIPFIAPFVAIWTVQDMDFPLGRLIGGGMLLAAIFHLASLRPSLRNWRFWGMAVLLFVLGASTYGVPIIRSWANPIIDMNNPGDFQNFQDYVLRKQYGQGFTSPRRGDFWGYQMDIFFKYFVQQFPHWLSVEGIFRRAAYDLRSEMLEKVSFSLIPFAFGIGGALWQARRDWRRFLAMFSLFLIMGVGLVVYLNMPDPEPRERDYIFVGAYSVLALWMGVGAAGVVLWASRVFRERGVGHAAAPVLVGAAMFILPGVMTVRNYHDHDRTGNFLAHDYAYNILQTCERDAILFTNGDNDTYPLWFMQYVKNVRPDVRVVNLSLIKTSWYVRQLRDLEPKVPINLSDEYIENSLQARAWPEPKEVQIAGITIDANRVPTVEYPAMIGTEVGRIPVVEQSTWLVWRIVEQNNWRRPVYFAITVPEGNHAGLTSYFSWEGMAWRVTPQKSPAQGESLDVERTRRNLFEVYRFTGLDDPSVYLDDVEQRLLTNYQVIFNALAQTYQQLGQDEKAIETLRSYERFLPSSVVPLQPALKHNFGQLLRLAAGRLSERRRNGEAAEALELVLRFDPDYNFEGLTRAQVQQAIQALKSGGGVASPLLKR